MNRSRITGDLVSQNNIFVDIANDRVGIGSTIPGEKLSLPDSAKIALGNSADLQMFFSGANSIINHTPTGNAGGALFIQSNNLILRGYNPGNQYLTATHNDGTRLYHNNLLRIQTLSDGIQITNTSGGSNPTKLRVNANEGQNAELHLIADQGDDNNDNWKISSDGSTNDLNFQNYNGSAWETGISIAANGAVELYHDNSKKFETTSSGVKFTGVLEAADNQSILLGNNDDFRIRHTGSHSEITDEGDGNLRLGSNQTEIRSTDLSVVQAKFISGGAVKLYHNNNEKLQTTAYGIDVTGTTGTDGLVVSGVTTTSNSIHINQATPEIQLNSTTHENDFRIINYQGNFIIQDIDALANRIAIQSDGTTIFQANVDCSAGIDVTGNITATGNLTIENTEPQIFLKDSNNDDDFTIRNTNGVFTIRDSTNGVDRLTINSSGKGTFTTALDVTGDLTVESTVPQIILKDTNNDDDFTIKNNNGVFTVRDSTNGVDRLTIASNGTTQIFGKTVIGDSLTRPSSLSSDADAACRIGGGDVHLYVASLGQGGGYKVAMQAARDSDFSSFTLNLQSNGGALQRGGNTVWDAGTDGAGSGLDADLLDGVQGSSYLRSDADDTLTGDLTLNGRLVANHGAAPATGANYFFSDDGSATTLGTAATLRVANDGGNAAYSVFEAESGSGSIRLANDGAFYVTGGSKFSNQIRVDINSTVDGIIGQAYNTYFGLKHADQTLNSEYMIISKDFDTFVSATAGYRVRLRAGGNDSTNELAVGSGNDALTWRGNKVFHAGNDGTGSGLDADTLDGVQGASFLRSDANDTATGQITLTSTAQYPLVIDGSDNGKIVLQGSDNPYIRFRNSADADKAYLQYNTTDGNVFYVWNQHHNQGIKIGSTLTFYHGGAFRTVWHSNNDGAGSGLDADTVDGIQGASFLRSDASDSATQPLTFSGGGGAVTIGGGSDIRLSAGNWTGDAYAKIQHHNNHLYIAGGSNTTYSFIFRYNNGDRVYIKSDGTIWPTNDSSANLGLDAKRWLNVYADNLYGSGANITALNADQLSSGTIPAARFGSTSTREFGVSATGNFGQYEAHGTYTDANTEPNFWGWNFSTGTTNFPNSTSSQWYRCRVSLGTSYGKGSDSSDYSMELCYPRNNRTTAGQMWTRTIENGGEGSWLEVGSRPYNSVIPRANNTIDLGSSSTRWRNIYTNDLNLSNEGGANDVDGTWGNFTIQEGEDDLFLINKRNGKRYKFNLTEVQ